MSRINQKPLIVSILEDLTVSELETLQTLINGGGAASIFRSLIPGSPYLLSNSDKGIKRMTLEIAKSVAQETYKGFLIWNDYQCIFINYATETIETLTLIELEKDASGKWHYAFKNTTGLTINELRYELNGALDLDPEDKVSANPTLAGTESELTGLEVGGTKYKVPTPTTIAANPTLAGTEAELTGLEVGSTKYEVGESIKYLTIAPAAANTTGRLVIVVLDTEPATRYDGYLYIITEAVA